MADDRNTSGGPHHHHHRPRPPLDGAFLLHLLQNPNPNPNPNPSQQQHQQSQTPNPMRRTKPSSSSPSLGFFPHGEAPRGDPAVAAMGPSYPFLPPPPNLNLNPHQHPLHLSPPPPGFHPRLPPGFIEGGFLTSRTGGYRNADVEQHIVRSAPAERRHHWEVGGFITINGQSSLCRGNEGRAGTSGIIREEPVRGRGFKVTERGDALAERLEDALVLGDDAVDGNLVKSTSSSSRGKDVRLDLFRGHHVSSQRIRIHRRELECRYDIESFTNYFMSIYKSLVPADEEKAKQKQLLLSLRKLVNKEWPNAQLHLYGSCANSFGFPNSDIDICLSVDDTNMSKPDILMKLADLLQSGNLENVQALTHARVPIVKMMDPVTGIACDICINNLLAVVNTKLLRDYAQIDERLRQLAFVVKHWAKSRGVNETYRGTLSSYAYVLMCIHFLQVRKPAILPCLQGMQATYVVTIDDTQCAYFDQVDRLRNFGVQNNESISRLLWGFFHYWAYCHDYANDVVSVRTGRLISKRAKDWTRRIGNDRHLICIEDPFEMSHDLGRVVDKYSIKILKEEFERAADILQYDPKPNVTLFEPYMPRPVQNEFQSDSFR